MDAGTADDGAGEVYQGDHGSDTTPPPDRITRGDANPHWSIMAGGTQYCNQHSTPATSKPYALYDQANGGITETDSTPVADIMIFADEDITTIHLDDRWSVD